MSRSNAVGLAALLLLSLAASCQAQKWVALLDGANQVPPLTDKQVGGATGLFTLTFNGDSMEWTMDVSRVKNFTMAHIHAGNASVPAGDPIVILAPVGGVPTPDGGLPVFVDPISGDYSASSNFTTDDFITSATGWTWDEFIAQADTENLYVNVHTTRWPAGAIRAQLINEEAAVPLPAPEEPTAPAPAPTGAASAAGGKAAAMLAAAMLAFALL